MSKWSEQYIKSQLIFLKKSKLEHGTSTPEYANKLSKEFCDADQVAIESVLNTLANSKLNEFANLLHCLLEKCESPIEKQLALALWVCADTLTGTNTSVNVAELNPGIPEPYQLVIKPQTKIGNYRVDFLLQYRSIIPKIVNGRILKDVDSCKQLVIECDGHDFHEKTKEQARKDKEKDRYIQSLGYQIFRFTGSEIWNDAFACASQSISAVIDSTEKEVKKLSDI